MGRHSLSNQEREDAVAEVEERMRDPALPRVRGCLWYAAFTVLAIAKRGGRPVLQAGSASWRFKSKAVDDGRGPTHWSYLFDPGHFQSVLSMAEGRLPQIHCWVGLSRSGEIVDLTTRHLPELVRTSLAGEEWTEAPPPAYFWGRPEAMPPSWRYYAEAAAIRTAFAFIRRGMPEVYGEMRARGLVPAEGWRGQAMSLSPP